MANDFLHNEDGITQTITSLKEVLTAYGDNVASLSECLETINSSEDWEDTQVKTAYYGACKSYINAYIKYISGLEAYIGALDSKSNNILDFEDTFSS